MPVRIAHGFGALLAALLVVAPWQYANFCRARIRNFRVVRPGVLYRSGQMSVAGLREVAQDYDVRTVIMLRDPKHPGEAPPGQDEEDFCRAHEITYHRISPPHWLAFDGSATPDEGVKQFLAVMDDANAYPVLIHCLAGIHRSGAFCAVYRMEYEHWTNEKALQEMRACGYSNLDEEWDILGYLEGYQPRWALTRGPAVVEVPVLPASRQTGRMVNRLKDPAPRD